MNFFVITLLSFLYVFSQSVYACDRDQAFNKMMAINRANQQMMNKAGSNITLP